MKKITILCNSPQCLQEITSGKYANLANEDIFTCNLAYNYFRTNGRHLNIISDPIPISDFLNKEDWYYIYGCNNYYKIEFIIHGFKYSELDLKEHYEGRTVKHSKSNLPGSSAVSALIYLMNNESYDVINLVGYTMNEWRGLKGVDELKPKLYELDKIKQNYVINNYAPYCYEYKKINNNN